MSYYPKSDNHITDKVKVILDLSNYATKKNENMPQALIHLIWLLKDFGALKTEIDTLDTDELVKVLTGLNNLKTKLNYLDVGKLCRE